MIQYKQNCWEFKKCGREQTNDCPAIAKNAGRICWTIAGTMCGGRVQGTFADKVGDCKECNFYAYMSA